MLKNNDFGISLNLYERVKLQSHEFSLFYQGRDVETSVMELFILWMGFSELGRKYPYFRFRLFRLPSIFN